MEPSNWIVQRLYDYAVKQAVELRLLSAFQHVVYPIQPSTVPMDIDYRKVKSFFGIWLFLASLKGRLVSLAFTG